MTQIVLISVDHNNARKVCEQLEDFTYPTYHDLQKTLEDKLGSNECFIILTISQFMGDVNDQILDNLENYFISYIHIN